MVYRGSLQTDDPRDAPRLVRMTPLRTSRTMEPSPSSNNNKPDRAYVVSSGASMTGSKAIYSRSAGGAIDLDRARLIEERRLCRERDIESVEKAILRTTGIKVAAPRLRNINEIRETVSIHATPRNDEKRTSIKNPAKPRPKTLYTSSTIVESCHEDRDAERTAYLHYASSRPPSSLLANLKDLERLRSTPQPERNARSCVQQRADSRSVESSAKSTSSNGPAKLAVSSASKIRADIMKIQQMFAAPADRGSRGIATGAPKTGNSGINGTTKIRTANDEKTAKSGDANRTRLLARKLIEVSRSGNREQQAREREKNDSKRHPQSRDELMSKQMIKGTEKSDESVSKSRPSGETYARNEETVGMREKKEQPQPPARKRRDGRVSMINDRLDVTNENSPKKNYPVAITESSNDLTRHEDVVQDFAKRTIVLERPDILDGLVKESDRQLEELRNDLTDRSRPRSHWRGFVQSMRLHDVELHSDSEDSKKGKTRLLF